VVKEQLSSVVMYHGSQVAHYLAIWAISKADRILA